MTPIEFDVSFDFHSDTPRGSDPDAYSPTLRRYHKLLWTKPLCSGVTFSLAAPRAGMGGYLVYADASGTEHYFGSDAITNSYTRWTRRQPIARVIAALTAEQQAGYLHPPYTIGSAMIWPVRSGTRPTINQARGNRPEIADRMDLTLECIRRHYIGEGRSPLSEVLAANGRFFALFEGFSEFVDFFHLQDLVSGDHAEVQFYLPFDDFKTPGAPRSVDDYITYREATMDFINGRQRRMADWVRSVPTTNK